MKAVLPFLVLATGSPLSAGPLDVFRDCDVCPEMIELPLGDFMMGALPGEWILNIIVRSDGIERIAGDRPFVFEPELGQYRVTIDIPIAMSRNEITYEEWMACVEGGGCNGYVPPNTAGQWGPEDAILRSATDPELPHIPSDADIADAIAHDRLLVIGGDYPVIYVSYHDAMAYVAWLNQKLGTNAYRLPTEAEWEYAARAGTVSRFAQGDWLTSEQGNYSGHLTEYFLQKERPDLRTRGYPVPVTALDAANHWGLRHMSGNAAEWTSSCYTERLDAWATTSEWLEKSVREMCQRSSRGGTYGADLDGARVAARARIEEDWRTTNIGFRVLKEMQ
jgi:formylglycine-generating enzyme required for sulfatase activity